MKKWKTKKVAEELECSTTMVREYAHQGWLSYTTRSGETGPRQAFYFDPEEVKAFADGGAPAAKAYREAKGLAVSPKRGRRVKA